MASAPIPVIATSKVFADYLTAARTNLDALVRLSAALKDDEFATAAQRILDVFDGEASDALHLITEANGEAWQTAKDIAERHPIIGEAA